MINDRLFLIDNWEAKFNSGVSMVSLLKINITIKIRNYF